MFSGRILNCAQAGAALLPLDSFAKSFFCKSEGVPRTGKRSDRPARCLAEVAQQQPSSRHIWFRCTRPLL
jgi:hypothetical protein